jgi:hypothetical protein
LEACRGDVFTDSRWFWCVVFLFYYFGFNDFINFSG